MDKKHMVAKKLPNTYKGKSTAPGGGGRFAMEVDAMKAKGMPESEAKAIAAIHGRKKYGKARFAQMGAEGRRRAAQKKG